MQIQVEYFTISSPTPPPQKKGERQDIKSIARFKPFIMLKKQFFYLSKIVTNYIPIPIESTSKDSVMPLVHFISIRDHFKRSQEHG